MQASTVGQVDDKLFLPYAGITRIRFSGSTLTVLSAGLQPSSPLATLDLFHLINIYVSAGKRKKPRWVQTFFSNLSKTSLEIFTNPRMSDMHTLLQIFWFNLITKPVATGPADLALQL
jgi:hypothetical protein